ncbi:hypothetical protein ACHHYP_00625 [Achlya hypogyna]|uniref:V-SNARE coiled-coil homology domain-containing protein n=1 Tax=Achlya hypogyna TaxID=1202772 RepID=A0A1V9ZAH9_ACHHY|nr:hypothetical protein ACHHYP_00625 [Achlya hypogyna]
MAVTLDQARVRELFADLARVHMESMELNVQVFHESISATIGLTGVHPLTDERAVTVGEDLKIVRKKTYYSDTPSNLSSNFVQKLCAKVCSRNGIIVVPKLFSVALESIKDHSADLETDEKMQIALIIFGTLEYWNLKAKYASKYETRFKELCDVHEQYVNVFMEWISDGSEFRRDGDVEEQELAMILVKMLTEYLPSDKRQRKKTVRRLRDFKDIPGLKDQLREAKQTILELEDPEIEWSEIIDSVRMRMRKNNYGEVRYRCKYVNGDLCCELPSELECAKFIKAKCLEAGTDWRDVLVLKDDVKYVAVARVAHKTVIASFVHAKAKKSATKFAEVTAKVLASPTWAKEVGPHSRHALDFDGLKLHFMLDSGNFVYFAVTTGDYPIRVAHQMLNDVEAQFAAGFAAMALTLKKDQPAGAECNKVLSTIATTYEDRTKIDKLSLVKMQVEGVKETMKDSINIALSNGEKLETLEQKSTELSDNAKMFHKGATDLHRQMWLRKLRLFVAIGVSIILVVLLILYILGVFSSSSSTSNTTRVRSLRSPDIFP